MGYLVKFYLMLTQPQLKSMYALYISNELFQIQWNCL